MFGGGNLNIPEGDGRRRSRRDSSLQVPGMSNGSFGFGAASNSMGNRGSVASGDVDGFGSALASPAPEPDKPMTLSDLGIVNKKGPSRRASMAVGGPGQGLGGIGWSMGPGPRRGSQLGFLAPPTTAGSRRGSSAGIMQLGPTQLSTAVEEDKPMNMNSA